MRLFFRALTPSWDEACGLNGGRDCTDCPPCGVPSSGVDGYSCDAVVALEFQSVAFFGQDEPSPGVGVSLPEVTHHCECPRETATGATGTGAMITPSSRDEVDEASSKPHWTEEMQGLLEVLPSRLWFYVRWCGVVDV